VLFTPADTAHMAIAKTWMGVDRPIENCGLIKIARTPGHSGTHMWGAGEWTVNPWLWWWGVSLRSCQYLDYTAWFMNGELARVSNGYYIRICLKTRCLDRDWNTASPEHKSTALLLHQTAQSVLSCGVHDAFSIKMGYGIQRQWMQFLPLVLQWGTARLQSFGNRF
jgi:hypothetical protein